MKHDHIKVKVITYDPANFKKNDFAIMKCNNVIHQGDSWPG